MHIPETGSKILELSRPGKELRTCILNDVRNTCIIPLRETGLERTSKAKK